MFTPEKQRSALRSPFGSDHRVGLPGSPSGGSASKHGGGWGSRLTPGTPGAQYESNLVSGKRLDLHFTL